MHTFRLSHRVGCRPLLSLLAGSALMTAASLRADVRINELFYHPPTELDREEWIELVNTGTNAVEVAGWKFTEGVRFTFPAGAQIPAGGFLVVAANPAVFATNHPTVTHLVGGWDGILSNSGQQVRLVDAAGKSVDSVRYADDGDWSDRVRDVVDYGHRGWAWESKADGFGASLELRQLALPNGFGPNWSASEPLGGTPGAANSTVTTNLAPIISATRHRPLVPKSTDAVVITSTLLDEAAAAQLTVQLHWRVDGTVPFTTQPMTDDGLNGDGGPGDSVFGAVIPAQANGAIVEFYVTAADAAGNERAWPAAARVDDVAQQAANALFQVDDAAPTAPPQPGELPRYRLILTAAERAELESINRNTPAAPFPQPAPFNDQTRSHAQFNATFISVDGTGTELRYLIGVRNRGNGSRTKSPAGLRLHLRNDDLWNKSSALNLNSQYSPAQLLGSALYQRAGLAAADSRPVQLRVNNRDLQTAGSPNFGFYVANEVINSEFAARAFPEDSSGNLYRGIRLTGDGADLAFQGTNAEPYRANYFKQSNTSQDDWRDLIELCRVLDQATEEEFAAEVRRTVNLDSWLRYFALETLVDNKETDLGNGNNGTGEGDDYHLYFGRTDPRARVVPYDLDTILGLGDSSFNVDDSLFRMAANPQVARLVKHPEFVPAYYALLVGLAQRDFAPEHFNPLVDEVLGSLATDSVRQNFKDFAAARLAGVLAQIPLRLTATNATAAFANNTYTTDATALALHGFAHAVTTRSVRVNGAPATWSAWDAAWTNAAVALHAGVNRVLVQAFDATQTETERLVVNVISTAADGSNVAGTVAANTAWTAANSPYHVTASLTIANGATLTIEPGVTVYLAAGANFTVATGGRLLAEGTPAAPIVFAKDPAAAANWGGLTLNGGAGSPETRIAYAHFDGNGSTAIHTAGATVVLDHLTFGNTAKQYLSLDASSFVVSHCHFPAPTAEFEPLHGNDGIKAGGVGILRHCFVGAPRGYNDAFDFTGGNRPAEPILQIIHNVFAGSGDDELDLDGTDAWIEGNLFLHVHKNGSPDSASAVSGGSGGGETSEVTVIGNLFYDCDQALTAKQGNFYTVLHNTIVRITREGGLDTESAVLNLADDGTSAGAGFLFEGNVIADVDALARNYNAAASTVTFRDNVLPLPWTGPGTNNPEQAPNFVHLPALAETFFDDFESAQVLREWFRQTSTSYTARIAGFDGARGVRLSGAPVGVTRSDTAEIRVGPLVTNGVPAAWADGAGFPRYRWRLDDGAWSEPVAGTEPIRLSGLAEGPHRLEAVGQNDAGLWQDSPLLGDDAVASSVVGWTVSPTYARVVLNEILARNDGLVQPDGTTPDSVELFNDSAQPRDLAGYGLGRDVALPPAFRFPAGTIVPPGGYLVLTADPDAGTRPLNLPFSLRASGDTLVLFAPDGAVADAATFGPQLSDRSIGRWDGGANTPCRDRQWTLGSPTFGGPNAPVALGETEGLKLNEWLAASATQFASDFVELYNPGALPVRLDGVFLTDNPVGLPLRHGLPPLSFVDARGYLALTADGDAAAGGDHLSFKLAAENGVLQVSLGQDLCGFPGPVTLLSVLDTIFYGPQFADVAQGRSPNGSSTLRYLPTPTPGAGNPGGAAGETNVTTVTFDLVTFTNAWHYFQAGAPPAGWQTPEFNDTAWPQGHGLFYVGNDSFTVPKNTTLTLGKSAYYFRTHFTPATNDPAAMLRLQTLIDDGALVSLNGQPLYRQNLTPVTPAYGDYAASTVSTAALNGPNDVASAALLPGDNVLAVEVHQANSGSSDLTFALRLFQSLSRTNIGGSLLPPVINEVLARNYSLADDGSAVTEWVELYNPNDQTVDLSGLALTDDLALPERGEFPPRTHLPGRSFLRVRLERPEYFLFLQDLLSDYLAFFRLDGDGDQVYLLDTKANSRALLDAVRFGPQVADLTIGRVPDGSGPWQLTQPTLKAANVAAPLGDAARATVNEWMPNPTSGEDWFELHNPGALPVDLSGWHVTDDLTAPAKHTLPPLSFLGTGAHGFLKLVADGSAGGPGNHVGFKLDNKGESIGLATPDGLLVSQISYLAAAKGVSEGRFPDSSANRVKFPSLPTPGAANRADADRDGVPDDWELAHSLSSADPADALADTDGDGVSNREEFLAGTDPRIAASALRATIGPGDARGLTIRFTAADGVRYALQAADSLELPVWSTQVTIDARPGERVVNGFVIPGPLPRFYRVVVD